MDRKPIVEFPVYLWGADYHTKASIGTTISILETYANPCSWCNEKASVTHESSYKGWAIYSISCPVCWKHNSTHFRITKENDWIDVLNYWNYLQWYFKARPFDKKSKIIIPDTYKTKTFFTLQDIHGL
jgi:transcription elongation factor Elf1